MAKKKIEEDQPDDMFEIDPLDVNDSFIKLPAQVARANAQHADAYRTFLVAKRNVDHTFATVYLAKRDAAEGKTTEAYLKSLIETDEDYCAAVEQLTNADARLKRLNGVCDALRTKRDALISVGANMRAEMQGDPSIREQHRTRRDVDAD